MKIDINELWTALFFWTPQKIDLDTGAMYSTEFCSEEGNKIKNVKYLPIFSRAPVFQRYIVMLRDRLGITDDQGLLEQPELEFVPHWSSFKGIDVYYEQLYTFVSSVSEMLENDRHSATPKYDPTFPLMYEYLKQFCTEFAKDWCAKEGLEWFE